MPNDSFDVLYLFVRWDLFRMVILEIERKKNIFKSRGSNRIKKMKWTSYIIYVFENDIRIRERERGKEKENEMFSERIICTYNDWR